MGSYDEKHGKNELWLAELRQSKSPLPEKINQIFDEEKDKRPDDYLKPISD